MGMVDYSYPEAKLVRNVIDNENDTIENDLKYHCKM